MSASNSSHHHGRRHAQEQQQVEVPLWVKIVSGSVGSTLTAFLVTPLEVIKVRQQASSSSSSFTTTSSSRHVPKQQLPLNVSLCPRGCGTFVLNNGLGDCVLPKSAVPYFDHQTGQIIRNTTTQKTTTTLGMIRRIFAQEGLAGIYAGLAPTLVMGVPNTVLYFVTYEEFQRRWGHGNNNSSSSSWWLPAVGGGLARSVASLSTAPLELIRTRQAARIGGGGSACSLWTDFQTILRSPEGVAGLYKGVAPTLARDVPFSAVYWMSIETLRDQWKLYNNVDDVSKLQQAGQALINGSLSGMMAAFCTTPLDVVKTLRQVENTSTAAAATASTAAAQPATTTTAVACDHHGAVVYSNNHHHTTTTTIRSNQNNNNHRMGTFKMMGHILETEGVAGLWKGNQARMIKVAPACAIMLSSYEIGKRLLTEE